MVLEAISFCALILHTGVWRRIAKRKGLVHGVIWYVSARAVAGTRRFPWDAPDKCLWQRKHIIHNGWAQMKPLWVLRNNEIHRESGVSRECNCEAILHCLALSGICWLSRLLQALSPSGSTLFKFPFSIFWLPTWLWGLGTQHTGLWAAGHLVIWRQIHALPPHLGERSVPRTEPASEEGLAL